MKTFTSLMIVILLSLCHYVDRLNPEHKEISTIEVKKDNFNLIEYENQINILQADTVYYTQNNTLLTNTKSFN